MIEARLIMKYLILFFHFTLACTLHAQDTPAEKKRVDNQIKTYLEKGNEFSQTSLDSFEYYFNLAANLCKKHKRFEQLFLIDEKAYKVFSTKGDYARSRRYEQEFFDYYSLEKKETGVIRTAVNVGYMCFLLGERDSSLYYLNFAINNAKESVPEEKRFKAIGLRIRSQHFSDKSQYSKAIKDLNLALTLTDSSDNFTLFGIHNYLASIYLSLEDRNSAEKELVALEAIAVKEDYFYFTANVAWLYAMFYQETNKELALKYGNRAESIFEDNGIKSSLVATRALIGFTHYNAGEISESKPYFEFVLENALEHGLVENFYSAKYQLGRIANSEKKPQLGLKLCLEAEKFFKDQNVDEHSKNVCDCLYQSYEQLGNSKKALEYYKQFVVFEKKVKNAEEQKEARTNSNKRKLKAQRDAFLVDQAKQKLENEAKVAKQRVFILVIFALLIVIVSIALFYIRLSKNRKRNAELLEREKGYLDNLLHNMVHEFRTPLTLIKGPTEELLKTDEDNELLQMVNKNGDRLLSLVNQVLDYAKIKSGNWEVVNEPTHLDSFMEDTIALFHPLAKQKNISIANNATVHSILNIDNDKLFKIISNLLSNAIKYSDEGTEIAVSAELRDQKLILTVSDQGIGIAPKEQKRIFNKFYQVDVSLTRKAEGTGIGLAFTQELISLMGGSIELTSELGIGTEIKVQLPTSVITAEEMLAPMEKPVIPSPSNVLMEHDELEEGKEEKSILIIEDNPDLRSFLTQLLAKEKYQILLAENGEEGVRMAIETIPDLIISDVMMPKKDGYQVVQELKAHPITEHIPIVILTAKASFDSMIVGLNHGADDYISKPFKSQELLLRIGNQLDRQEKMRLRYQGSPDEVVKAESKHSFILKVEQMVSEDFTNQFSVEELAEKCALSRSQLHRKVKSITGLSATGLLTKIRMDHAIEDVKASELNISEISYKYGYSDPANFSRIFKKQFGKTPSEIREGAI